MSQAAPQSSSQQQEQAQQLRYVQYDSARETEYVAKMRTLISKDLSEPYSIYVYRYFLYQWGDLSFMVRSRHRRTQDPD